MRTSQSVLQTGTDLKCMWEREAKEQLWSYVCVECGVFECRPSKRVPSSPGLHCILGTREQQTSSLSHVDVSPPCPASISSQDPDRPILSAVRPPSPSPSPSPSTPAALLVRRHFVHQTQRLALTCVSFSLLPHPPPHPSPASDVCPHADCHWLTFFSSPSPSLLHLHPQLDQHNLLLFFCLLFHSRFVGFCS